MLNEQYCRLGWKMLATNFIMNYNTVQLCKSSNGIPKTLLCIHKISCEKRWSARNKVIDLEFLLYKQVKN